MYGCSVFCIHLFIRWVHMHIAMEGGIRIYRGMFRCCTVLVDQNQDQGTDGDVCLRYLVCDVLLTN